jgi:hypothetical protein
MWPKVLKGHLHSDLFRRHIYHHHQGEISHWKLGRHWWDAVLFMHTSSEPLHWNWYLCGVVGAVYALWVSFPLLIRMNFLSPWWWWYMCRRNLSEWRWPSKVFGSHRLKFVHYWYFLVNNSIKMHGENNVVQFSNEFCLVVTLWQKPGIISLVRHSYLELSFVRDRSNGEQFLFCSCRQV